MCRSWRYAILILMIFLFTPGFVYAQKSEVAREQSQRQLQQPLNNAPVWREVRSGNTENNTSTVKSREATVLINSQGQAWRQFRNGPVTVIGGALIALIAGAVILFYLIKGTIQLHAPRTGRLIPRFSDWERLIHWCTAITFVALAVTGLIMFFGKYIVLPMVGYTVFSWLAKFSITLHNFVGPFFAVCVVFLFFTFLKKNGWQWHDLTWIKKGGGLLNSKEVPSGFFNAGEKLWFWGGLTVMGFLVSVSGFVLDFANFGQTRNVMQIANLVHVIGAICFVCGALGHIYMGTLGMAGAFEAMRTGYVDETWAKEHHEYWYNEVKSSPAVIPPEESSTAQVSA